MDMGSKNGALTVEDAPQSRINLGLGSAAVENASDILQVANNLSDLSNVPLARDNLGLGSAALINQPIANGYLQNDSVTINTSGTVSGGGTVALGGTLNLVGSGGGSSENWVPVTDADNTVQILVSTGYICNGVSLVQFLLPLSPTVGDYFEILSSSARFQINQNGGQQIRTGTGITTAGSGYVLSNSVGDRIYMNYVGGNVFLATAPQGTVSLY